MAAAALVGAAVLPACEGHQLSAKDACAAVSQKGSPPVPKTGETAAGLEKLQSTCRQ
jgi:hypothetical protein